MRLGGQEHFIAATRQSLRDSPTITDNGILIDDLTVSVNGRVRGPWHVVSNLLSRMERDGLVARTPRAGDGRGVDVAASAHALDLFVRFDRASTAIVADAASALPPEDLAALDAALPALERLRDLLVDLRHGDAASGGEGADGDAEGLA